MNVDFLRPFQNAEAVIVLGMLKAWSDARHEEVEAHMNGRRETRAPSRYVFPSRTRVEGDHHMRAMLSHACDRVRTRSSVDFKPHDLRRTGATLLGKLGVNRFMVQRVLNHADSSVTGMYDRYAYQAERMDAVTKLGRYITAVTAKRKGRKALPGRDRGPPPVPLEKMSHLTYPDAR